METTSQKPVLRVAADEDLSDLIVRSIRDQCGMKGCTIKEIQKLIHATYTVEISDDLDLFRLIIVSCKKSIKHGRLFKHGCKYRVSFSEFSLDPPPPSNGATIVAEKSCEKSTVFVCELCKENGGEGRQAASVNITKDGAHSESVWTTTTTADSSKKCCLCQSHVSFLTTDEMPTANSSLLNSLPTDDELLSPSAMHSTDTPTKNTHGNEDRLSTAPSIAPGISDTAGHINFKQDSLDSPSKPNRNTTDETASPASQPTKQNLSLRSGNALKRDRNSETLSPDSPDNRDSGKARKTKNRRTQVKFLTDGLTPFYSSDGKRKRPSLATGLSPLAPRPKKLRLSLDGVGMEGPALSGVGGAEGASVQGTCAANLTRLTVEVRRKKRMYSSENHGTYQLERGVKEDILFPHITEDDVKMFELARSHARQRQQQQQSISMGQSSSCLPTEQEEEQPSSVPSCQEHRDRGASPGGVSSYGPVVMEEATSLSRNPPSDRTDPFFPAEDTHPSNKLESDIPCTSGFANLVDDDSDDAMNDDFADDVDDDADYGVRDDKHVLDREIDGASNDRKTMSDSSFGNNNSLCVTADNNKENGNGLGIISELTSITDASDAITVKAAEDKICASHGILNIADCMEKADASDTLSSCEKSNAQQTCFIKSSVINRDGVTDHVTEAMTNNHACVAVATNNHESGSTDPETADVTRCDDRRDADVGLLHPSNTMQDNSSFSGDAAESIVNAVFRDGRDSVAKGDRLVAAVSEDGAVTQHGNVSSNGLESFTGESALVETSVVENQTRVTHIDQESVLGGISDLDRAVQQVGSDTAMSEPFVERGQSTANDNRQSGEDSAVMGNCEALKLDEIDVNCGRAPLPPTALHSTSCCDSLICTASPLQSNSSIISTCIADIGAESGDPDISKAPSELCRLEQEHGTTAFSKDQHSEDLASSRSTLQKTDAVLDVPNKDVLTATPDVSVVTATPDADVVTATPEADVVTATHDADIVTLPLKRNRRRKRFFCPDGCCSLDSDARCGETKKADENPVKPRVGCPKGAKQKPPPQPVVTPKVPRPRGRPRKYPLPTPVQEEPSQPDIQPHLAAPSLIQSASITPINAGEINSPYRPEQSGDADETQSGVVLLNVVGAEREELDRSECLPCTSASDVIVFQKDFSGDGNIANAHNGKDEPLESTCATMQGASANVAATLTGPLSIEAVDLGVETGVLIQVVETPQEKDVGFCDKVMGRCELESCLQPCQAFEREALVCGSVTSALQTQTIIETTDVTEKDASSCGGSGETLGLATTAGVSEKDVKYAEAETLLQSVVVVRTPDVLDQTAPSCGRRTEGIEAEKDVTVARVLERDLQSCHVMTAGFESELGLQDKRLVEKDNPCGGNVTDGFELENIPRKENGLQSFNAGAKRSESDFVEAGVYHYIDSTAQEVAKCDQGCAITVSNHVTPEMINRGKSTANTERANVVEKGLYHCTLTQECPVQSTDLLLSGSPLSMGNCQHVGSHGASLDPGLQAATTTLLHDCYMPLNNLTSDCHIQVPMEFQMETDSSQIQLTVLPSSDNRVHVLSDPSEALMRHLQLNGLASDVCSISDHRFTHAPGTVFSSQNNAFIQACPSLVANNHTSDPSVTFLNTSCGATAANMQMPPNASSNSVGGGVQDAPWSGQPSNLLYALQLQAPTPMANFGLNFPSNLMYALPIQSMLTGMNFERSDPNPEPPPPDACNNKPDGATGSQASSGPCPVHAQSARGLMPQMLGCQPYIIICPGSLPISSILQPLSESLGQILPYLCSQADPRHLSCHSSVHGNFVSPLQQYSWGLQAQNASAPAANVAGQYAKVSADRNPAVDLFTTVPSHSQQLLEGEQQGATFNVCSIAQENQVFTSVNASQLIADGLFAPQFVTTQNIPVPPLSMRSNLTDFSSVPIQIHSSGFNFPPGK